MKSTGIVRKIDELGRIVLPMELRRMQGIKEKEPMEVFVDGDSIVIKPYRPGCDSCGEVEELIEIGNAKLCPDCINKAREQWLDG